MVKTDACIKMQISLFTTLSLYYF